MSDMAGQAAAAAESARDAILASLSDDRARSMEPADGYHFSPHLTCLLQPDSAATDSIRSLRSHLMAGHVRGGRRALAVCAPESGVGNTFVAANLAVAFAQAGINTLLIDANLHRPGVERYVQTDTLAAGLRQMLSAGVDEPVDEIRRDVLPNLSVLYAGGTGSGSSELLANRQFKQLIDECMRDFEFTIVDTPAENAAADVSRVAISVRSALIVARRNQSYTSQVKALATQLSSDGVRLVGTFLTDF